jgi:hypothetical protein
MDSTLTLVILSAKAHSSASARIAQKDLTERPDAGRGAGVRSFATLRTTGKRVVPE